MVPSFVEAVAGEFLARSGTGFGYSRMVAPTRMREGDQLIAVIASDADHAYATIPGKLTYEARKPGAAGSGTTLTLVSAGALAITVDTQANVTVTFNAGVTVWSDIADILESTSTILTDKVLLIAPATVVVGGDAGVFPATANPGGGIPYSIVTNVAWDFDDALVGSAGAGVRVFRRVVTDDEPLEYTFDHASTLRIQLGVLAVYRGVEKVVLVGASAEINNTTVVQCPELTLARTNMLYVCGCYLDNMVNIVPALSNVNGSDVVRVKSAFTILGSDVRSLHLFDSFASLQVPGKYRRTATLGGTSYGSSFAVALSAAAPEGARHVYSPIAIGSIGLPAKGI